MDPNKEPKPMTNSAKAERDSEINSNSRDTPREPQAGQGDMDVRFLTRPPNSWQSPSHLQRQREPQPLYPDEGPGRSSESAPENHSVASGSNQCLSNSKISSNSGPNDSATAGSSKSNLNINNGLDPNISPLSIYKLEVDKDGYGHIKLQSFINRDAVDDINNVRENRKRPSSLKLNRPNMDDDSSSLSDYSLGSEDGCIYTYRGGEHLADLPSSFFSLDMGLPADRLALPNYAAPQGAGNAREGGSRASSPDMEFLEMDFDPGPSNEGDSGEESTSNADLDAVMEMPEEMPLRGPSPSKAAEPCTKPAVAASGSHSDANFNRPSTSRGTNLNLIRPSTSRGVSSSSHARPSENTPQIVYGPYITHINARGDAILVRRTKSHSVGPVTYHLFGGGELVPKLPPDSESMLPEDLFPLSQLKETFNHIEFDILVSASVYHASQANALLSAKQAHKDAHSSNNNDAASEPVPSTSTATSCVEPPRSMIWSEAVACERQVTQISTSACGATAVVNVFNALGVPVDIERINTSVGTRLRANNAAIPSYLLSRAVAGCTAADLINGIQIASGGLATARFFQTYPERAMSLSHFLADWISLGAVPILTLNLQNGFDAIVPDAWHHQMVFGVSPQGIYLCNPVECVRETLLWTRLVSPSVLLVKARDVVSRFTEDTDLTPLMYVPDARFHTFNVFGQVANVLRESRLPWRQDSNPRTHHVRIPAAYQAGVTVAVLTGSEAHQRLMVATQLPLLKSRSRGSPQNDPA